MQINSTEWATDAKAVKLKPHVVGRVDPPTYDGRWKLARKNWSLDKSIPIPTNQINCHVTSNHYSNG